MLVASILINESEVGANVTVVMPELLTFTLTAPDVVVFPAESLATAVRVCKPFEAAVVSQEME